MRESQLTSQWAHFERPFQLMAQWDGPRGILFTAHDTSADEAAEDDGMQKPFAGLGELLKRKS